MFTIFTESEIRIRCIAILRYFYTREIERRDIQFKLLNKPRLINIQIATFVTKISRLYLTRNAL